MDTFHAGTDKNGNPSVYDGDVFICCAPDMSKALGLAKAFSKLRVRKQEAALKAAIEKAQEECPAPIPPEAGPITEAPDGDENPDEGTGSQPGYGKR